jgi:ribosome-associated protein
MNNIPKKIKIPEWELEFRADRSSGPGGQNVNKTATKVTVRFDVNASKYLNDEQKGLIKQKLSGYLTREGEIVIYEQSSRSQLQNRKNIVFRLNEMINEALTPEKQRGKTKVPKREKEKRIESKKVRSEVKKARSRVIFD